tara:strand:+ start:6006 stop:6569 length:564 start_codon:yes stop_codon:yes gene_type:complete
MNIVLIGFKGSGKTTAGKLFADKLNYNFIDIDSLVLDDFKSKHKQELNFDVTIQAIYKNLGEYKFRKLEEEVISKIHSLNNTIIATGGGSILSSNNQKKISELGTVFYLKANPQDLFTRMEKNKIFPDFIDAEKPFSSFYAIYSERVKLYESIADIIVDVSNKSLDEVAFELLEASDSFIENNVSII